MLNKYRLFIQSAGLLVISELVPALYPLKGLALVPFLLKIREDATLKESLFATFSIMLAWTIAIILKQGANLQLPILNTLALILYVISRKSLGPQRSYIALTFLWLSAEALPFSFPFLNKLSYPLSGVLFDLDFLQDWLSLTGFLGASFWILLINMLALAFLLNYGSPLQRKPLLWSFAILIVLGIILPIKLSPQSRLDSISDYPQIGNPLLAADLFLMRMSYFLAFFLLLFSGVKHLMRNSKRDDRFT